VKTEKVDVTDEKWLRESGALPPGYTPTTEIGWKLVRLRGQFIANGGKFATRKELEKELASLRE
jgi:hypothetical protein